jgi:hypothetical protein
MSDSGAWPSLDYEGWKDTLATVHLWTQVVGKVRLERTPWINHSWHVPLYVTARGLGTSPIPAEDRVFEMDFDFVRHSLDITVSDGGHASVPLVPRSVADFYGEVMGQLDALGVPISFAERRAVVHACGCRAATALKVDQRSPIFCR